MMGPGHRRGTPQPAMSLKGQGKLLARVLKFMMHNYGGRFVIVLLCILVTAICTLQGTLFTKELIDVYIKGIMEGTKTFADLGARLLRLACILAFGVASAYLQQRIMVIITQGSMLKIRNELFTHMETLPVKYFDTHSHGDIYQSGVFDTQEYGRKYGKAQYIRTSEWFIISKVLVVRGSDVVAASH